MSARILVFMVLILYARSAVSQMDTVTTTEIIQHSLEYPFYVLPAAENGLVIYRQKTGESEDEFNYFEFLVYDNNLEMEWQAVVRMDYALNIVHHAYADDHVYIVFSGVRNFKRRLFVYRLNVVTHVQENIEIETFFPDVLSYFDVFGNNLVIGGIEKAKPSIVFYDLQDMKPVILQGFYEKNITLFDIHVDEENELFTVTAGYLGSNRQNSLQVKSYDPNGMPVEDIRIQPANGADLLHAKSIIANHNYRLISGVYRDKKSPGTSGLFTAAINLDGSRKTRYFPFGEIFSLYDSLRQQHGEEETVAYSLNEPVPEKVEWHVTDLGEFTDDNVFLLESFFTEKGSSSFMDRELIYYYQKALLIAVNDDLSIRGISQFGLSPIVSGRLRQNIYLRKYADNLKMLLFDRYMVVEKTVTQGYSGKPLVYTEMGDKGLRDYVDRADSDEVLNFRHWYGDYYLLTGLLPSGGRDNDHILVINKVFYP